jgi:hypothetical protein
VPVRFDLGDMYACPYAERLQRLRKRLTEVG